MSREMERSEFITKLAEAHGQTLGVLLVLPERAVDPDAAFVRLTMVANKMPALCWTRMGLTEVALLSEAACEEMSLAFAAASSAPSDVVLGVGLALTSPIERFASLELGLHEAKRTHPATMVFELVGERVQPT